MAKTSSMVKNRWSRAAYEQVTILVKKGEKEKLKLRAEEEGVSVSRFILDRINAYEPGLLTVLDDTSRKKRRND